MGPPYTHVCYRTWLYGTDCRRSQCPVLPARACVQQLPRRGRPVRCRHPLGRAPHPQRRSTAARRCPCRLSCPLRSPGLVGSGGRGAGIPVWAPAVEADAVESGDIGPMGPDNLITRLQLRTWAGPRRPVARRLREGDEVAGFTVLETPGHSPGHLSFWRERDRALLAFDVIFGRHPITGRARPLRAARPVHARPRPQPRPDPQAGRAGARAGLLRPRPAAPCGGGPASRLRGLAQSSAVISPMT